MVGAREGPFAQSALERPVTGVLAVVAGQLIRSRKFPPATFPIADIGLFTGMGPLVGF